jgi:excisionase family DNA binding protein
LPARQAAELLGVPQSWVYEQSRAGRIPAVTLGHYRGYRREAIEGWLIELEQAARQPGRLLADQELRAACGRRRRAQWRRQPRFADPRLSFQLSGASCE